MRVHASSGTTGKPTTVGYTQNDVDLGASQARTLAGVGALDDVVQVAYGYGLTGGLGMHSRGWTLGAP